MVNTKLMVIYIYIILYHLLLGTIHLFDSICCIDLSFMKMNFAIREHFIRLVATRAADLGCVEFVELTSTRNTFEFGVIPPNTISL